MVDVKHYLNVAKDEVKSAFSHNKLLLLISTLIFVIPLLIGYFYPEQVTAYVQPIADAFEENVANGTVELTTQSLFVNNVTVAFILYALGALGGLLAAVILGNNGLFIGFTGTQFNLLAYVALVLPHGIFEIPAIIIATTGGFALLSFVLRFIWGLISPDYSYLDIFDPYFSKVKITVGQRFTASFKKNQNKLKESFIFLCLAVVLLIIAAFVEANITVPLAKVFLSFFGIGIA
ncbi:stage II sporulation protein M [Methanobrevibacter sp.]|uniref:stage II sporulation protein M n=1 Tax=Methanobrevibacter sp. TaxID=66852 RepID=UPI00388D1D5D